MKKRLYYVVWLQDKVIKLLFLIYSKNKKEAKEIAKALIVKTYVQNADDNFITLKIIKTLSRDLKVIADIPLNKSRIVYCDTDATHKSMYKFL